MKQTAGLCEYYSAEVSQSRIETESIDVDYKYDVSIAFKYYETEWKSEAKTRLNMSDVRDGSSPSV